MPSDLPHLPLQPHQQPLLQQTLPEPYDLREQLHHLDITAQTLKADKATLEKQLKVVRGRIAANDNRIRRTMKDLDKQLFHDQRAERQPAFQTSILEDENVIEGIWTQMQLSPQLQKATEAIVKEEGTLNDNSIVSSAIMTELTGNTFQFAHDVAARVLEFDPNKGVEASAQPALQSTAQLTADPAFPFVDPTTGDAINQEARDPSIIAMGDDRDLSVIPLLSPSVKSEAGSIATPYNVANSLPALTAAALNSTPGTVAASVESTPSRQATPRTSTVAHGMNSLRNNFPGLLETLSTPTTRARPTTKRGRESVEVEVSPSPSPANAVRGSGGKRAKIDKEPGQPIPPTSVIHTDKRHSHFPHLHHVHQIPRAGSSVWQIHYEQYPMLALPADQA